MNNKEAQKRLSKKLRWMNQEVKHGWVNKNIEWINLLYFYREQKVKGHDF